MSIAVNLIQLFLFLICLIFGIILYMAVMMIYCSIILMVVYAGRVSEIINKLLHFSEFPLQIFPQILRIAFITVIPYAVWAYMPVQVLLNRLNVLSFISGVFCIFIFWISIKFWNFRLLKYTSAGG